MNKRLSVAVALILCVSAGVSHSDTLVTVTAKGRVAESWDNTNLLGYGANADGQSATMVFTYRLSQVPADLESAPYFADYYTDGYYGAAINWVGTTIQVGRRGVLKSGSYKSDYYTMDQVKVVDRVGGALSADYFGVSDRSHDCDVYHNQTRYFTAYALVYEYVQKMVTGESAAQSVSWRPDNDGSEVAVGKFRVYGVDGTDTGGTVVLSSFTVSSKRVK